MKTPAFGGHPLECCLGVGAESVMAPPTITYAPC
jgi:hypothetical protein